MSDRKKGFTMVELIVVIVIILVLAAVLVPSLLKYIRKAQEAAAIEECAGVVKMAAVERSAWLAEGGTAPTKEEIVQSAGANGEIKTVTYSEDDFDVTYMMYECKNGIVVIYEYDKDPQFRIAGENESAPLTVLENFMKEANDIAISKGSAGREQTIKDLILNGGLLEVDSSFKRGTDFENTNLVWYPYYIGPVESRLTLLYAGEPPKQPVTEETDQGYWNGWNTKMIYLNGKTYVSENGKNVNVASLHSKKTEPEVIDWLEEKGFVIKE